MASTLDSKQCLTLKQVVGSFSAPITEEHAWSVVYEMTKTLDLCLDNPGIYHKLYLANRLEHVYIHEEGLVNDQTFIQEPESGMNYFVVLYFISLIRQCLHLVSLLLKTTTRGRFLKKYFNL